MPAEASNGSTAIGHATSGRTATSAWAANDEIVFKGLLKHLLILGVMAFDVSSVAINEVYSLTPGKKYTAVKNLGALDIVTVIDVNPTAGEGIVVDDDITFLDNLTGGLRANWTDSYNVIVEEKADPTNKVLYTASLLEIMCYAYQVHTTGLALVYTLYDFALLDSGSTLNKNTVWDAISGTQGPVELEKAHVTLANSILGAPSA